jgi:hypothetical protein
MTPGESAAIEGYVRGVVGKAMHRDSDVATGGERQRKSCRHCGHPEHNGGACMAPTNANPEGTCYCFGDPTGDVAEREAEDVGTSHNQPSQPYHGDTFQSIQSVNVLDPATWEYIPEPTFATTPGAVNDADPMSLAVELTNALNDFLNAGGDATRVTSCIARFIHRELDAALTDRLEGIRLAAKFATVEVERLETKVRELEGAE